MHYIYFEIIYYCGILVLGALGLFFAWRRLGIADRNARQEKFRLGAELVGRSGEANYVGRVAGARILAQLLKEYPKEFNEIMLEPFEAFLQFPPTYGKGAVFERRIDYFSLDTQIIKDALNGRDRKIKKKHLVRLPGETPFTVNEHGDVLADSRHPDYCLSLKDPDVLYRFNSRTETRTPTPPPPPQ